MYIKDLYTGTVRLYGTNCHDSLRVSPDGRTLSYENLQNGDGSRYGDYRFCDEEGKIPDEDEVLVKHGADAYFNIGGFDDKQKVSLKKAKEVLNGLDMDELKAVIEVACEAMRNVEEIRTSVGALIVPKGTEEKLSQIQDDGEEI